ncbi:Aldo/keto reductase [Neoconidiobolus thromboides FSU 785]|nr:Aldo/keto reductase [Neoconidiobolus thromboides FSU 785]
MSKARIILGTMTFGEHGVGSRIKDLSTIKQILSKFQSYGYNELDTARMYCDGNTEEVLGQLKVQYDPMNFILATKVYPNQPGDHSPEKLRSTFETSLTALKSKNVDIFYLHAPDHNTPIEDTLAEVDKLYKEGKFKELGLSNYAAWQVAEIIQICKFKNYILPTVYQGMYNLLTRSIEDELFPVLKKYNLRFYAYNPLCGGMASGQYKMEDVKEDGSRFDPNVTQGQRYRERFWKKSYFEGIESIRIEGEKHNIQPTEIALRWLIHHSKIQPFGNKDAIILGVSSMNHLETNIKACQQGPLPKELLEVIDNAWLNCKATCPSYFR